jgi:threonine/homoserine/homoserine lactone efflux protein
VHGLAVFLGVAIVVTLTPGPATALVVRSALRGGRRSALLTTLGNSVGVLAKPSLVDGVALRCQP